MSIFKLVQQQDKPDCCYSQWAQGIWDVKQEVRFLLEEEKEENVTFKKGFHWSKSVNGSQQSH